MTHSLKLVCMTAALAVLPTVASAYRVATPDTYSDLLWGVSTNVSGLSGCTELQVDATGDLVNSSKLTLYGALNCPFQQSGSYGVVGSAYFGADGSYNMTLLIGSSTSLECIRWPGLSGSCTFSDTTGRPLGGAFLSFR